MYQNFSPFGQLFKSMIFVNILGPTITPEIFGQWYMAFYYAQLLVYDSLHYYQKFLLKINNIVS